MLCLLVRYFKKVYIFGKSSIDFVNIIRSCLGVDVNSYFAEPDLFICKQFCYKKLLKFQHALEHLEEVRKEIQDSFKNGEQPRIKRQIAENAFGDNGNTDNNCHASACISSTDRANFSTPRKSLKFVNSSAISPKRSFASHKSQSTGIITDLLQGATAPIIHLTSTPISKGNISEMQHSDSISVKLSVRYPSKTVNKTLCKTLQAIGKALAHGNPSQIANAVMNCPTVKVYVIKKVLSILNKEVTSMCSKSNHSMLRRSSKEDLEKFDLELLCNEWRARAPLFYSFLMTVATNKITKGSQWFGSVAVAGSVLLKQKSEKMNATSTVLGIVMKSKSIEVSSL